MANNDWSQYAKNVYPGSYLVLLAFTTTGGDGYLYELLPNDQIEIAPGRRPSGYYFNFYPGYNSISVSAELIGLHKFYFEINGKMSNEVVVDVGYKIEKSLEEAVTMYRPPPNFKI